MLQVFLIIDKLKPYIFDLNPRTFPLKLILGNLSKQSFKKIRSIALSENLIYLSPIRYTVQGWQTAFLKSINLPTKLRKTKQVNKQIFVFGKMRCKLHKQSGNQNYS